MKPCLGLGGRIPRPARANRTWVVESLALREQIDPGWSNHSPCANKSTLGGRATRPARANRPLVVESRALREQIDPGCSRHSPCASNSIMGARAIRPARANRPWVSRGCQTHPLALPLPAIADRAILGVRAQAEHPSRDSATPAAGSRPSRDEAYRA